MGQYLSKLTGGEEWPPVNQCAVQIYLLVFVSNRISCLHSGAPMFSCFIGKWKFYNTKILSL